MADEVIMSDALAEDIVADVGKTIAHVGSAVVAEATVEGEGEGGQKRKASDDIPPDADDEPAKKKKASARKGVARPVKPKKKAEPKRTRQTRRDRHDKDGSTSPDPVGPSTKWNFVAPPQPADKEPAEHYRDLIETLIKRIWHEEAGDSPTFRRKLKAMPFEELYPNWVYCRAIHYLETALTKLDHIALVAGHAAWKQEREERNERKVAEDAGIEYEMWRKVKGQVKEAYQASSADHREELIKAHGSENRAKTFLFNTLMNQYRQDEPDAFFGPQTSTNVEEPNGAESEKTQEAAADDPTVEPITTQSLPTPLELAPSDLPKPTQETFPEAVRELVAEPSTPTQTQPDDDMAAASNASVFDEEQDHPPDSAKIREAQVNELLAQINAPFLEQPATSASAGQIERVSTGKDPQAYEFPVVPAGPLLPSTGVSLPGLFAQAPRPTAFVEQDAAKPASEQGDSRVEPPASAADQAVLSLPEQLSGSDRPEPDSDRSDEASARPSQYLALPPASAAIKSSDPAAAASSHIPPYRRASERVEDETDYDDSPVQGVFKQGDASAAAPARDVPDGEVEHDGEDHDEELFGTEDGSDRNPYEEVEQEERHEESQEHEPDVESQGHDETDESDEVADDHDVQVADPGDVKEGHEGGDECEGGEIPWYHDPMRMKMKTEEDAPGSGEDDWYERHGVERPQSPQGWKGMT
ncbi:hypothetical protein Tdes44962_MAKER08693 [Teratosphaeria destructans]|uniref:Uncharacterized protein n=1 Tax=Teratosphaeria destructans TaxID=418781 RepID=A0A9W7SVQ0_9PEZI|nr:hypothetical protein Tdes44962_MAKER08693 [Teratosphaeria destructans]